MKLSEEQTQKQTWSKNLYDKIIKAVDDLPEKAIERTKASETKKGYDTTGYKYQYLVNILNEIVGVDEWEYSYIILKEDTGSFRNGSVFHELTVDITLTILGASRTHTGGHRSANFADALKGAKTNALKKTMAMFGLGKQTYEGTIDDDSTPIPTGQKGDDDVQPEPELQLVELPDGRKVTPEVAVEEYIQKQNIKEETSKQIFDIIVRHSIDENKILDAYKIKTIDDLDETNGQKLLKQLKTKYEV